MKWFFVNNWRAILHILGMIVCFLLFWLFGIFKFSSDNFWPNLFTLAVSFFSSELSIKLCKFENTIEELIKEIKKEEDKKKDK